MNKTVTKMSGFYEMTIVLNNVQASSLIRFGSTHIKSLPVKKFPNLKLKLEYSDLMASFQTFII